jgi:hypothetical protein
LQSSYELFHFELSQEVWILTHERISSMPRMSVVALHAVNGCAARQHGSSEWLRYAYVVHSGIMFCR